MEFGLDQSVQDSLDWSLALRRIRNDVQSDFIYAPHLSAVFVAAGDELRDRLSECMRSGRFRPRLPITLEIPKPSGFSRPGSILWPLERLAYQVVVDAMAPTAENTLHRDRVFSSRLLLDDPDGYMFKPAGDSYALFRDKLLRLCREVEFTHVVASDVASYFEHLYQHVLVNLLDSSGCQNALVRFLEKLLAAFMQKDSHGIVQGVFPSDFLGSFYLCAIDAQHEFLRIPSLRYVDDLYAFFRTEDDAKVHQLRLATWLRGEGLTVNEAKSGVWKTEAIHGEETAIDGLFRAALAELESELDRSDFYGSTISWDVRYPHAGAVEETHEEVVLEATRRLFDAETKNPKVRKKINAFCLAAFTAARDDYAVDYVIEHFLQMPYMAQQFAKYLKELLSADQSLGRRLAGKLSSEHLLFDFQRLWLYALLATPDDPVTGVIRVALRDLKDGNRAETVRAACASIVGKYGSATERRLLRMQYESESSPYVRAAILYAARFFPASERGTCFTAWGGHDEVNPLIIAAAKSVGEASSG